MSFFKSLFKAATKVAAAAVGFAVGGPAGAALATTAVGAVQGDRGIALAFDAVGGYTGGATAYNLGSGVINSASLAAGGAGGVGSGATLGSIASGVGNAISSGSGISNTLSGIGSALSGQAPPAGLGGLLTQGGSAAGNAADLSGVAGSTASAGGGISSYLSNPALLSAANVYSGIQGTAAAKAIAAQQQQANANALALQSKIYDQTSTNMQPFLQSGTSANQRLSDLLGISGNTTSSGYGSLNAPFDATDLQNSPGYQFQLQQGTKAMNQSLGAQGNLFSGQALKAAQTFGQGLADQTYNDAYNRYLQTNQQTYNQLNGVSGSGQNAAANLGAVGQNYANTQTTGLENVGNINANKTVAQNTATNQGLAGLINGNYGFTGGGLSSYQAGVGGQGNQLPIYDTSNRIIGYKAS